MDFDQNSPGMPPPPQPQKRRRASVPATSLTGPAAAGDTATTGTPPTPQKAQRKKRCGACSGCKTPDCGRCSSCLDKKCFGGEGKRKQGCLMRRCVLFFNAAAATPEAVAPAAAAPSQPAADDVSPATPPTPPTQEAPEPSTALAEDIAVAAPASSRRAVTVVQLSPAALVAPVRRGASCGSSSGAPSPRFLCSQLRRMCQPKPSPQAPFFCDLRSELWNFAMTTMSSFDPPSRIPCADCIAASHPLH